MIQKLLRSTPLAPVRCHVPTDLDAITDIGREVPAGDVGLPQARLESIWDSIRAVYRTGYHPAIQVCLRHRGAIVLDRAVGHVRGIRAGDQAAAGDPPPRVTTRSPFTLFSASKSVTAILVHLLEDRRLIHLDDRVCEYLPEFHSHGKDQITLRHLLTHRAGIPEMPPGALCEADLSDPGDMVEHLANVKPRFPAGERVAYHAVSSGFLLGEIVQRVAKKSLRQLLKRELKDPLGLDWLDFGVTSRQAGKVVENLFTGPPVLPPLRGMFQRALGASYHDLVDLSNQKHFLTGVVPALNLVSTARDMTALYQVLLDEGRSGKDRLIPRRAVRRIVAEQTGLEFDWTTRVPLRFSTGMVLGGSVLSMFGPATARAFGHNGFTNIFTWADPERELSAALVTSGKPLIAEHLVPLVRFFFKISGTFPRMPVVMVPARGAQP